MPIQKSSMQFVALNKLIISPRNVRRKDRKSDIETLSASIASRGLLQNLCVVLVEDGRYEVVAGGRRLGALKLLAKKGVIPKDWPVPCNVVEREAGKEVSLTENVHRVAMDAMDEVDAFAALVSEGSTPDEVAHRFGVTRRHVDQRLALSGLSPRIKAAWKRGDVTLDAAKAFCVVDDHSKQDAVFRSLGRPVTNPSSVRARLMDGRVRASDRLAVFVGLDAYEAAGGMLLRDLFDVEAVFVEDPALLAQLAESKLNGSREVWLLQGWSWVECNLGGGRHHGISSTRFYPEWRDPTSEEQAELDALKAKIEVLDAELESNSQEDDDRWSARDDLEAAYETIRQAGRVWTPEQRDIAGVMLGVDHDGELAVTEGLVKVGDQKQADAYLRKCRAGEDSTDERYEVENPEQRTSALPKAVNRDLTLVRTRAIRLALSGDLDVALAVCVATLMRRSLQIGEMTGVALSAQMRDVDDHTALVEARAEIEGRLPTDEIELLEWALDLSREPLLAVLAVLVAGAIDLTHEDTSPADQSKQGIGDLLAQRLDIDMTRFWKPDLAFWVRLPKSALMHAFAESPGTEKRSVRAREDLIKAHAKLRKDELAAKVSVEYEGAAYLPDILVTPVAAGGLAVTAEGVAAASLPAVAAE